MQNVFIAPLSKDAFDLDYSQIAVLVDENTLQFCYPLIKDFLPKHFLIQIKSGEEEKNLETCAFIWQKLTNWQFDRKALLINLGGGVIGDMGGFCAATYKRGIDFIQIPTTLLSQVDASVGGKLGIDFQGFKNHIGVFCLPKKVLIDTQFLKTLPFAEVRSGFAEVIKHSLIADKEEWKNISKLDFLNMDWNRLVAHSLAIKEKVVRQDPTEKGLRKILNFGHTVGHAVETFYLDKNRLLHGEAIAVGMIAEAWLSCSLGMISETDFYEIEAYLKKVYEKVAINPYDLQEIAQNALQDKKNESGKIKASLLTDLGSCGFDVDISIPQIIASLHYYIG